MERVGGISVTSNKHCVACYFLHLSASIESLCGNIFSISHYWQTVIWQERYDSTPKAQSNCTQTYSLPSRWMQCLPNIRIIFSFVFVLYLSLVIKREIYSLVCLCTIWLIFNNCWKPYYQNCVQFLSEAIPFHHHTTDRRQSTKDG